MNNSNASISLAPPPHNTIFLDIYNLFQYGSIVWQYSLYGSTNEHYIVHIMNKYEKNFDELEVLRKIENNPEYSQRDLAYKVGFSLGKLNYCMQSLRKKGHIKIQDFKKNKNKLNYNYLLTPKGISHKTKMLYYFLKQKTKEYEELKNELKKK